MDDMTEHQVDVAIVGYGPGGAVLASLLGQQGHQVAVLETCPNPYSLPRASTVDGEIIRILQHAADPTKVLEHLLPQKAGYLYGADGQLVQRTDWDTEICGHPEKVNLHQPIIESTIQDRIKSYPSVQLHWSTTAVAVEDFGDHVIVTAKKASLDDTSVVSVRIRARYLVGMDGSSSFVRQAIGVEMNVLQVHEDEWLMTDFDILDPAIPTPETGIHMEVPRPYYWGPNGIRRCRIDMKLLPDDDTNVRTHESASLFLKNRTGIDPEAVRITRQVSYRFKSGLAERMRVGSIFIGGDAAHQMNPAVGQGFCSSMRDGISLAWRLSLVLKSRASAAILDSYGPERIAHVTPLVRSSITAYQMITETDPAKAASRDNFIRGGLAPMPPKPTLTTGFLQRRSDDSLVQLAGTLSPQGRVMRKGRDALLDDLLGFGFQLVSRVPVKDLLPPARLQLLADINAHIVIIGPNFTTDLQGTYLSYMEENGIVAFLARPDFYIFGTAFGADDIPPLVDALAKELAQPTPGSATAKEEDTKQPGAGFTYKNLPVGEFLIQYAEAGPSKPAGTIVSLPGSAGLEMSTAKDELSQRYRVLEINPPGWGDMADVSRELPQSEIGTLLAKAVEQLVEEKIVLIATSMGGANALYLTEQIPNRVRGIILEGSMAPSRPQDLRPLSADQPPIHPKKPWATPSFVAHQMENRIRMVQNTKPDMDATSAIRVVCEREIPVLGLLGTHDEVLRTSQKDTFHSVLPKQQFKIIPDGRHDLQNTCPDQFVALVENFINERLS